MFNVQRKEFQQPSFILEVFHMMSLSLTPRLLLKCGYCEGSVSDHETYCPQHLFDMARSNMLHYGCPACDKNSVEVNSSDYFECCSCHRQFSRADNRNEDTKILYIESEEEFLPVIELPELGKGDIPVLKALDTARLNFRKSKKRRK